MAEVKVGTPIWSNGFGSVTWVSPRAAGVALLVGGEPKITGVVPIEQAEYWAQNWLSVCQDDGRIQDVTVLY